MVTWGRAFRAAGAYILYIIVWTIVASLFIAGGFFSMIGAYVISPYPPYFYIDWGRMGGGIVLMFIGYFIIALGSLATFFKINSEVTAEEVRRQIGTVTPAVQGARSSTTSNDIK